MHAVAATRQVHVCAYCSHELVVVLADHCSVIVSNKSWRATILTIQLLQGTFGLRTCHKLDVVLNG